MKTVPTRWLSKTFMALAVVVATVSARPVVAGPQSQDLLDLMSEGKTQTDLGNYDAAAARYNYTVFNENPTTE